MEVRPGAGRRLGDQSGRGYQTVAAYQKALRPGGSYVMASGSVIPANHSRRSEAKWGRGRV